VPTEQLYLAASHLSELTYRPLLRKKDWKLERSAIIREWEGQQNDGDSAYLHQLLLIMFPNYPQLQVGPLGTLDSINAITVDDLAALHRQDYTVNNSQLVLTGKITDGWLDVLEKTFGRLKLSPGESSRQEQQVANAGGKKYSVSHELFPHPFLGINGILQIPDDKMSAALSIFVTMLADGCLSSPIFGELREKRGLVYSYGVDIYRFMPGLLRISFECGTNHANLAEVEKRFWEIVEQTSRDQERFTFAKDRKLGKMSMRVFDPEAEADDIADQLLLDGYYVSDEEQERVIGSLQFEEVAAAAKIYFDPSKFFALTMRR
jgi:predicted Zn-dependent peptidase